MKIGIRVVAAVALMACGSPTEGNSPNDVGLQRTYALQTCNPTVSGSARCAIFITGSTNEYADSARVTFNADRTVTWTTWLTKSVNGCYLSGENCPTVTTPVDVVTGSYVIKPDGVHVVTSSGAALLFAASIANTVDETWAGPEALATHYPRGNIYTLELQFR